MGKHRLFDLAESPIHDTPKNKEQTGESKMLKSDRRGNREKNTALLFAISSYFIGCYKNAHSYRIVLEAVARAYIASMHCGKRTVPFKNIYLYSAGHLLTKK